MHGPRRTGTTRAVTDARLERAASKRTAAAATGGRALEVHAGTPRLNRWYYSQFQDHVRGRVLEVGAGIGNLTPLIAADAASVVATEIEDDHLDLLRENTRSLPHVQVHRFDLEDDAPASIASQPYDVVMSCNVIEHLEDDVGAVRRLADLLEPGGAFLTYVPATPWAFGPMDSALGHYRRYTTTGFDAVLRQGGLIPVETRYMNVLGLLGWWVNGRILGKDTPDPAQVGLFEKLMPIVRWEDHLRVPVGLGVVSIARKPGASTIAGRSSR